MQRFAGAVNHSRFHQVDDAVGTHFRVNAEIMLVVEAMQYRLGDAADAGLNRCAVGNERSYVASHVHMHFGEGLGVKLEERSRGLNEC